MPSDLFAVLLASIFTAGCIIIHASRGHAERLTPHLLIAAASLSVFVGLIALADRPQTVAPKKSIKPVEYPMR